jgi:hypothetical protein
VFVDLFSDMPFGYLQQPTSEEENLMAEAEFEHHADTFGVKIIHFHADNGRFAEKVWKDDIGKKFSGTHVFRLRSPPPKWQSGKADQGPTGSDQSITNTRKKTLARRHQCRALAICATSRKWLL